MKSFEEIDREVQSKGSRDEKLRCALENGSNILEALASGNMGDKYKVDDAFTSKEYDKLRDNPVEASELYDKMDKGEYSGIEISYNEKTQMCYANGFPIGRASPIMFNDHHNKNNSTMSEKQADYKNEFKHRLMQESHELTVKIDKLSTFIDGEHFCKVEDIQRVLLTIQLDAMRTYSSCLKARIENL